MNKKIIWLVAFLIIATLSITSCAPGLPTPPTPTYTSTPPPSTTPTITKTTTPPPPTTPTKTTTPPASSVLFVPEGQQFTGGIQNQGGNTSYFVDKAPFCAYGGAPVSGYTWSLANLSTLPPGTTFDPLTGIFYAGGSGIALVPGTHTFKMVVSNGSGTATGTFSLVVNTGEILGTATFQKSLAANITLPGAKTGVGYGASLWAVGNGALPWSWSIRSGGLPPGLEINPTSGVIHGTPLSSAAGNTYTFTISVKDGIGAEAIGEPTYSIFVTK